MPQTELIVVAGASLVPLGFAMIAAGGLPPAERWQRALVTFLAALGLALIGYALIGFALQHGGVGLAYDRPGYDGLIWEWSAFGPTWGPGWGMAGLAGWTLSGPASTPAALTLALANVPWVLTAALIPLLGLRGRIPAWASGLLGLAVGALIYPLAGNWIWGGGWLANLGSNLGLGHGFVDAGGGGAVHLLAAAIALAGIVVFLPRHPKGLSNNNFPLWPVSDRASGGTYSFTDPKMSSGGETLPLLRRALPALLGVVALLVGGYAWIVANPLFPRDAVNLPRLALNGLLAAAAGALLALGYTWLVAGASDGLMAARGLATAFVAALGCAAFVPSWAALLIGAVAGLLAPPAIFLVNAVLRWDDPTAALTVHGLGGALGLLAVGLFADGTSGAGWNAVGAGEYLGVPGQGVTGLLAAGGMADWPGQMQAQGVGLVALILFGFFAAWLCVGPLAVVFSLLRPREATSASAATEVENDTPTTPDNGAQMAQVRQIAAEGRDLSGDNPF